MTSAFPSRPEFLRDLQDLLNRHGIDGLTNTPDFILAAHLAGQIDVWGTTLEQTRQWHDWPTLAEKLGVAR